jgi:DNA modification methylase
VLHGILHELGCNWVNLRWRWPSGECVYDPAGPGDYAIRAAGPSSKRAPDERPEPVSRKSRARPGAQSDGDTESRPKPIEIVRGDCLDALKCVGSGSVQLILTSPPYADQRESTYGGVHPDEYIPWFLPRAAEFQRVLKPEGTFVLNIKENVVNGTRHPYVRNLVAALESQGWLLTEEWIWHKKTCTPGKWPNRFRDAWEHVYQFNKQRKFDMYQDEVKVPVAASTTARVMKLGQGDRERHNSDTRSGFGRKVANWVGRDLVYPTNVLHLAPECGNKGHSAVFPVELPRFFVRLFSKVGDTVLDPFLGSGTTAVAAHGLGRSALGCEVNDDCVRIACERILRETQTKAVVRDVDAPLAETPTLLAACPPLKAAG